MYDSAGITPAPGTGAASFEITIRECMYVCMYQSSKSKKLQIQVLVSDSKIPHFFLFGEPKACRNCLYVTKACVPPIHWKFSSQSLLKRMLARTMSTNIFTCTPSPDTSQRCGERSTLAASQYGSFSACSRLCVYQLACNGNNRPQIRQNSWVRSNRY